MSDTDSCLMHREQIQHAVKGCKGDIIVINTFGTLGNLFCQELLASAQRNEPVFSFPSSHSGEFHGSIFNACLIAEHADEFMIRTPSPGPVVDGIRGLQHNHDFGSYSFVPAKEHMRK